MASPSIASYFNVRKRAAADDIVNARNKVIRLDGPNESTGRAQNLVERAILAKNKLVDADTFGSNPNTATVSNAKISETITSQAKVPVEKRTTRRTAKRTTSTSIDAANKESLKQPKIVKFTLGGSLSPRKKSTSSPAKPFQSIERNASSDAIITPTKQPKTDEPKSSTSDSNKANIVNKNLTNVRKELSFDDIKSKIGRSSRLDQLKAQLNKQKQLEEQYQACINKRNAKQKAAHSPAKLGGQSLKEFDTIELEVLSRFVFYSNFFFTKIFKYFLLSFHQCVYFIQIRKLFIFHSKYQQKIYRNHCISI